MSHPEQKSSADQQSVHVKNPAKIFWLSILFLLIAGAVIYYIDSNTNDLRQGKSRVDTSEGVATRIQPVAQFSLKIIEGDQPLKTGKEVYDSTCTTCHAAGIAGAPKFGDKDSWAPFIAAGYASMLEVALNGKGAMPAKGGNTALSDLEVERAMVYMANQGGANFAEPGEDSATTTATEIVVEEAAPAATETVTEVAVATESGIPAATEAQLTTGKQLYDASCFVCHAAGVAGAPKFGSKDDWAPYMATGLDAMLQVAISGKGAMPPRGTAMNASDDDLRSAILYMVESTK